MKQLSVLVLPSKLWSSSLRAGTFTHGVIPVAQCEILEAGSEFQWDVILWVKHEILKAGRGASPEQEWGWSRRQWSFGHTHVTYLWAYTLDLMHAPTCVSLVISLTAHGVSAQRSHVHTNAHIDISWGSQAKEAMSGKGAVLVNFYDSCDQIPNTTQWKGESINSGL